MSKNRLRSFLFESLFLPSVIFGVAGIVTGTVAGMQNSFAQGLGSVGSATNFTTSVVDSETIDYQYAGRRGLDVSTDGLELVLPSLLSGSRESSALTSLEKEIEKQSEEKSAKSGPLTPIRLGTVSFDKTSFTDRKSVGSPRQLGERKVALKPVAERTPIGNPLELGAALSAEQLRPASSPPTLDKSTLREQFYRPPSDFFSLPDPEQ